MGSVAQAALDIGPVGPHARQIGTKRDLPGASILGCCLASLLNRRHEFQQVGVDFVLMRSRETVGPARIMWPQMASGLARAALVEYRKLQIYRVAVQC